MEELEEILKGTKRLCSYKLKDERFEIYRSKSGDVYTITKPKHQIVDHYINNKVCKHL